MLPLRRKGQHRVHLVPYLIKFAGVDQTTTVGTLGLQTTLTYPAPHRHRTPAHALSCLCDRKHRLILRPDHDGPSAPPRGVPGHSLSGIPSS